MSQYFEIDLGYDELRALKEHLEKLFEHPGWKIVQEFIETRAAGREKELLSMCPESVEQMVRFARVKGGVEELQLLPKMLEAVLSDARAGVKNYQEYEAGENDGDE